MTLIAHYPLLTNAKDSTMGNNHGTVSGPYFVTGGKLGGSVVFTLASDKIVIPHNALMSGKIFGRSNVLSISVWVYPTSWVDYGVIIAKAVGGYFSNTTVAIWQDTSGLRFVVGSNQAENPTGSVVSITSKPALNAWYHLVGVLDGVNMKFYINNVQVGGVLLSDITYTRTENTSNISMGPRIYNFSDSGVVGNVADLRIYDHALSLKEIKELSRAKVVHYKFNDFQEPTVNTLGGGSQIASTSVGSSFTSGNIQVTRMDQNKYKFEYLADSVGTLELSLGTLGQTSATYNHTISANIVDYYLAPSSTGDFGITRLRADHNYIPSDVLNGASGLWNRAVTFSVVPGSLGVDYFDDLILANNNVTIKAGSYIIIENLQSEKSAYATPFTKSSRSAIVTDISGYDRDIVKATENPLTGIRFPKWIGTSAVGQGAYDFSVGNCEMIIPYGNGINPSLLPHTISLWVQTPTTTGSEIFFSTMSGSPQMLYLGKVEGNWDFGIQTTFWGGSTGPVIANKPTHIGLVLDGANAKLYVDGVLRLTKSYTSFILPTNFYLGNFDNSSLWWTGLIHDVRIYSSAFSASGVLELYKQRGSLDENGTLSFEQFSSSTGAMHRFLTNPMSYNATTVDYIRNGIISLTSTDIDPFMHIAGATDFINNIYDLDTTIFKIFQFKYRIASGGASLSQVLFINSRRPSYNADQSSDYASLNADGNWHIASIDLSPHPYWTHSPVTGIRFDFTDTPGITIEIEFIRICKDTKSVDIRETGIIEAKDIITDGPLHGITLWWPLDNSLGDVVSDNSTSPIIVGGVTPVTFIREMGYQMNGTDGYIRVSTADASLRLGTLSFWVYIDPTQSWASIFNIFSAYTLGGTSFNWLKLSQLSPTTLRLTYSTSAAVPINLDINENALFKGKPAHVSILYSDSGFDNILQIFVNGVALSYSAVGSAVSGAEIGGNLYLMADNAQYYTKGKISDVRMYSRLLSSQEVNLLYERGGTSSNRIKYLDDGELYIKGNFKEV